MTPVVRRTLCLIERRPGERERRYRERVPGGNARRPAGSDAVPARAVLAALAAEDSPHLGPVSLQHGFMLATPPASALPGSHRAWDEAAAALPSLWRDLTARRVLGSELPHLPADPHALPDDMLWRASVVLGAIAYSFVRCDVEHMHELAPIEIPAQIAQPWTQVAARMGRTAPLLAYDDLFTHNFRLLDPHAPEPIRLENLRLLVPLLGNDAERAFFGGNIEIQARLTPVVGAAVRAQEAVAARDRDAVVGALLTILAAVRDATEIALPKVDPNPHAAVVCDPAVWAKLIGPTGIPIVHGVPGVSGAGSTGFQLVDTFLGRTRFDSPLGVDAQRNRAWYAPNCRRFLDAVDAVSVRGYISEAGDKELAGLFQSVLDAYAGDRGYLGVHRRKVYGFSQTAYKVGRPASASGISGGFADRTWREVDRHLSEARDERYLAMFEAPQTAIHADRTPAGRSDHVQRVTLDVHDTGLVFRPGDRCAILPEHTTELVQRTLTALRASADRRVPVSARWRRALQQRFGTECPAELGLGELLRYARLRPLDRVVGKRLALLSGSDALWRLLEARDEDRVELWDALELAARAGYDVTRLWRAELWQDEALTRMIPPEPERMYSVSDRPDGDPFAPELVLTTGQLAFTSPGPDGEPVARHGTGSTYLARAAADGAPVTVRVVRPLRFAPVAASRPIVMFAGGTGIAPFRGFVRDRAGDPAAGPTWLFAAAQSRAALPYLDELGALAAAGRLQLRTAFSREEVDGVAPRRIGAAIAEPADAAFLRHLLRDGDGVFYVCGQGAFAVSVLDALGAIAADDPSDGAAAIRELVGSGRLRTDLFTTFAPRSAAGVAGAGVHDASELVLHNDAEHGWWTAINGIVYDMTEFRQLHPGGLRIIDDNAGLDATSEYRAVLHHEDSEIEAMLAMYKSGFMRRLSFGRAWGIALHRGALRYVPLRDAFATWLRRLYLVVEYQNSLRNDVAVLSGQLTTAEQAGEPTALKLMLAADIQGRILNSYVPGIGGDGLRELWELACGLFDPDADPTELARALADDDAAAAGRARAATQAFRAAVAGGDLDPAAAWPHVEALLAAAAELVDHVKLALRDGAIVFETHEARALAHGAPVLAALRTIPPAIAAFHERVARIVEDDLVLAAA